MAFTKIGKMSLKNQGGFVCRIRFSYLDEFGEKRLTGDCSGDILLGGKQSADPLRGNVPDGSIVAMYVYVLLGRDNESRQYFLYEEGNPETANYVISGTTFDSTLGLIDISHS